jgi:hypothetical protein
VDRKTREKVEIAFSVQESRRLSTEANLAKLERQRDLPEGTGVESGSCDRHPNWRPARRAWWFPRKPSHMCEMCAAEIDNLPEGPTIYVDSNPRRELPPLSPRHAEMAARNIAKANGVAPGSQEETVALERIKELRDEERTSKSRRRGVPAFQKIENGELVTYLDMRTSIRQRPQLVRARP